MAHPPQQPQAGFFDPWAPPPGFAAPPADTTHADRIKLLAKYAAQNGPTFIDTVATKQAGNPEYAFLEPGGEGHEFYRWALYCQLHGLPMDQPAQQQPTASQAPIGPAPPAAATSAPAQAASAMDVDAAGTAQAAASDPDPAAAAAAAGYEAAAAAVLEAHAWEVAALPPEVAQGFTQVLDSLTGSKESIKNSQAWFLACRVYSAGMARMMADRTIAAPTFDTKLHVLYLANDILFKALAQRPQAAPQADGAAAAPAAAQASDDVSRAFAPVLGAMLAATLGSPDAPADARDRLTKMLSFWSERNVYSSSVTEGMQTAMDGKDARAALVAAATGSAPAAAAAAAAAGAAGAPTAVASSSGAGQPAPGAANPWLQHPHAPGMAAWPHAAVPGVAYPGHVAHPAYAWPQHQVQPHAVKTEDQDDQKSQTTTAGVKQEQQVPQPYPGAVPYAPVPSAGWYIDPTTGAAMPYMPAQPYPGVAMPVPGGYPAQQQWAMQHAHQQQWAHYAQQQQQGQLPPQQDTQQQDIKKEQDVKQEQQQQQQFEQDAATSAFAFPPGLIPQLVWDKARHSETYSPLSPLDIEDAGLPPPPEKDAYLRARLERFHAEIRDWRPGTTRADFEERREKEALAAGRDLSDDDLPGGSLARRRKRIEEGTSLFMPVDPETGMRADGSFAGPRMGGPSYAGLGSRPRPTAAGSSGGEGDVYNSYRSQRSGAYHEMILESLAKGNAHSNLSRGGRR